MNVYCIVSAFAGPLENDRVRIQAHLTLVEAALRAHPPPHLTPEARAARLGLLDVLHTYRECGEFPHNHEAPHVVPVFRDHRGTDCAVGALIRASGEADLAERIDQRWHLARVWDMDEPRLLAWADQHGFTVAELAWIQPGYSSDYGCYCEGEEQFDPVCANDGRTYWNSCVATHLAGECPAGPVTWSSGFCPPYSNPLCPEYSESGPAPVLDAYSSETNPYGGGLCGPSAGLSASNWDDWFVAQEAACIESAGDPFDGPDCTVPDCPNENESSDTGNSGGKGCAIFPEGDHRALVLVLVLVLLAFGRGICARPITRARAGAPPARAARA